MPDTIKLNMKDVVDDRYLKTVDGVYYSHQPIYGYRSKYSAPSHISRYIILSSILRNLARYRFTSFLDVGGAEGWTAYLVKSLFDCGVFNTDLSSVAAARTRQLFGINATQCPAHSLPFRPDFFDAVLCSETLEHIYSWKQVVFGLVKTAASVVVITVPHEKRNKGTEAFDEHVNFFDEHSLDFLAGKGYTVKVEKTLSPFLVPLRVIAEGRPKEKKGIWYKLYNLFCPLFRTLFGVKWAIFITNADRTLCRWFPSHFGGLTFIIEKRPVSVRHPKNIRPEDFIFKTITPKSCNS